MPRVAQIAILAAVCVALWWLQGIAADYQMFGGALALDLDVLASLVTAIFCVALIAETVVGIGIAMRLARRPTGFEHAGIYFALSIVAILVVFSHFGVNVITILATSAVVTAVIGLALQPTLGALIAGLVLSADRILKVGDGIVQNNEVLTVMSIGWRSVLAARGDGTRTCISNTKVLDGTMDILPAALPVRAEFFFVAPLAGGTAPHR